MLSRFVAYVGSPNGMEQKSGQCVSQFRHLRNFKVMGMQRILVLANTRGQPQEADHVLYSRVRLIWATNLRLCRAKTSEQQQMTCRKPQATERATVRKLHWHTEAATRRHREADLHTTPTDSTIHNGKGCRLGCCGGAVLGTIARTKS